MALFPRILAMALAFLVVAAPLGIRARSMGGRGIRHYGLGGDPFGRSDIAGVWIDQETLRSLRAGSGQVYASLLEDTRPDDEF